MKQLALLLVALAALALPLPLAEAQEPVAAIIQGPTAVAPSSTHPYTITVTGGPGARGGTFEIKYGLEGSNLAGGDPQIARTLTNAQGRFTVNVTAPRAEGSVQLVVTAASRNETTNATTETRLAIDVARPVELRATLRNLGAAAALNVTVYFYVDGQPVGNTTVARIDAGAQTVVSITYIPVGLTTGRHTVRVEADLDGDGTISPARGEVVAVDFFYKFERSLAPTILGTITVVIVVVLLFVLLAIRRQRCAA